MPSTMYSYPPSPLLSDRMVRLPSAFCYDFWQQEPTGPNVLLDCLMPNGLLIPLEVPRDASLQEVKEELWEKAAEIPPLQGILRDMGSYNFSCINNMAENEELMDENRRLYEVKPFINVLRVVERKGDKADQLLNAQISLLIGKGLHDFDRLKNPEVNDFRSRMKVLADEMAKEWQSKSWVEKVRFQFPARLASSPEFPEVLQDKLKDSNLIVTVKFDNMDATATFTLSIPHTMTVHQVLVLVLHKKSVNLNCQLERPSEFALKVAGSEEYLLGDIPIGQFMYIQEAVAKEISPVLVAVSMDCIPVEPENPYENPDDFRTKQPSFSTLTLRKRAKTISSWTVEEHFSFRVNSVRKLNCEAPVEVVVEAGLFHGGRSLCEPQKTRPVPASEEGGQCEWEEDLQFDLKVCNMPRMARLCLVAYEVSKSARGVRARRMRGDSKQELFVNPLAWVNSTVYDFRNQLRTGAVALHMWTYAEDAQNDDLLHPLGTVVSHPDVDHATGLTITFHRFHMDRTVIYPSIDKLVELAGELEDEPQQGKLSLEQLRLLSERDPLHEMHEQEKKLVWSMREECLRSVPEMLPKLLDCVEWNDHRDIARAASLVRRWPKLPVHRALELLDYAYADEAVRSYAVQCLREIEDEELSLYLLQLVQTLKHESYLQCDLAEFLLRRALTNQKIGHYLFWHLRSEMHVPSVSVRFGLVLEAYCRGNQEHVRILTRQMEALNKLKLTNELVRQRRDKEKGKAFMKEYLAENHCSEALSNFLSPLEPSHRLRLIKVEKCGVMDSKMRPLWTVFQNADSHGSDIYIIFKNGDDLRQDMLTLQMIRIMDRLWKAEGLDLRMSPYGCISTDYRVGLIDVVLGAETIANIQKEKGVFSATCAFRKGSLFAWLKDHNVGEQALSKAIEEFTLSCAGYCVATYVLGIADRHSDNIMVKRNGQLFHIDFGHILGHFKEKFGFRRERVPFVLTHDFVYVITRGQARKEAPEFERFQQCCEQAFLILRRHGSFIISLFAMMISTGLPELSSEKDLNYLRDTLVLDFSEQEALRHFKSKFDEALRNSWKTSLNWATHNFVKNNKQ